MQSSLLIDGSLPTDGGASCRADPCQLPAPCSNPRRSSVPPLQFPRRPPEHLGRDAPRFFSSSVASRSPLRPADKSTSGVSSPEASKHVNAVRVERPAASDGADRQGVETPPYSRAACGGTQVGNLRYQITATAGGHGNARPTAGAGRGGPQAKACATPGRARRAWECPPYLR